MKNVHNAVRTKTGEWVVAHSQGIATIGRSVGRVVRPASITTLAVAGSYANAALSEDVTDLITGLVTDVGLLFAATIALWAAIRGFLAVFKLGNKFISKAGA